MKTQNEPEKGNTVGGATLPRETQDRKNGEAAATASPVNNNPAGLQDSLVRWEASSSRPPVESKDTRAGSAQGSESGCPEGPKSEPQTDTIDENMNTMTPPAPEEEPDNERENVTRESDIEAITAEEIMAKHAEQVPSEENGFTLDEVVATEHVVPVNLARAAGVNFRKPTDKEFIRVTQNQKEIMPFDILEVNDETQYIVTPAAMSAINKLHEAVGKKMIKTKRVMVHLTVNMDGVGFLWPITVMGKENTWVESANICASIAKNQWIRIVSNQPAKRYDYHPAQKHAGAVPQWPKETFIEMLNLAFKNKVIRSLDHPAIKQLLDEE